MECNAKHTKYQPTDEEFRCPRCGKGPSENGLVIDEAPNDEAFECEKLHDEDILRCFSCDYTTIGKEFANRLVRKNNLIPCPHCKGTGYIKGK